MSPSDRGARAASRQHRRAIAPSLALFFVVITFDPPVNPRIDPRLTESLRLLVETRDVGERYVRLPSVLHLTLAVTSSAELPQGAAGWYDVQSRTIWLGAWTLAKDPRFVVAALPHELQHAGDADMVAVRLLEPDCLELEARGFESQAQVGRALWPGGLPNGTDFERQLAELIRVYERDGRYGVRARLARDSQYRQWCEGAFSTSAWSGLE